MTAEWQEATNSGDSPRVATLIASGADLDALDRHGQTALMNASHKGHVEVVRLSMQHRAKLNHTAKYGLTALILAVIADHPDVVRLLVDAGADILFEKRSMIGSLGKWTRLCFTPVTPSMAQRESYTRSSEVTHASLAFCATTTPF